MDDDAYNPYQTSHLDPIDLCEGHEERLNHIFARLGGKQGQNLSHVERLKLEGEAELLTGQLEERNRRLDSGYFNWER